MVDAYHFAPMSEHPLPKTIEPFKLVTTRALVAGAVSLNSLSRLQAELANTAAKANSAEVELAFQRDPQGYASATGFIRARGGLVCQRCLAVVSVPLDVPVNWAFVTDEDASCDVPKVYDAIILDEEAVSLFDLIEDELLLALPPVPMHEDGECKVPGYSSRNEKNMEQREGKKNPFEVLAEFKKKS